MGQGECPGESSFFTARGKRNFFLYVRIRFCGSLRTAQIQNAVGTSKIQYLQIVVLIPMTTDFVFGGAERSGVLRIERQNFELHLSGLFGYARRWDALNSLVQAIDRSNELSRFVVAQMELQTHAHVPGFDGALPGAFCSGDGVCRSARGGARGSPF